MSAIVLSSFQIEGAAGVLGALKAQNWIGSGDNIRRQCGFSEKSLGISIVFKDGGKLSLEFGGLSSNGLRYGAVKMEDGQSWVFEFPPPELDTIAYDLSIKGFP